MGASTPRAWTAPMDRAPRRPCGGCSGPTGCPHRRHGCERVEGLDGDTRPGSPRAGPSGDGRLRGPRFGLAQGNWDGAGLTWGIIGFTLKHGDLDGSSAGSTTINPTLLQEAFGAENPGAVDVLDAPLPIQLALGRSHQHRSREVGVGRAWGDAFSRLGRFDEVQALQIERADRDYFPARAGHGPSPGSALRARPGPRLRHPRAERGHRRGAATADRGAGTAGGRLSREQDLRIVVGEAVAAHARPEYREDVRSRKRTLALGSGLVHGSFFHVRDRGLDESEAVLTPPEQGKDEARSARPVWGESQPTGEVRS